MVREDKSYGSREMRWNCEKSWLGGGGGGKVYGGWSQVYGLGNEGWGKILELGCVWRESKKTHVLASKRRPPETKKTGRDLKPHRCSPTSLACAQDRAEGIKTRASAVADGLNNKNGEIKTENPRLLPCSENPTRSRRLWLKRHRGPWCIMGPTEETFIAATSSCGRGKETS